MVHIGLCHHRGHGLVCILLRELQTSVIVPDFLEIWAVDVEGCLEQRECSCPGNRGANFIKLVEVVLCEAWLRILISMGREASAPFLGTRKVDLDVQCWWEVSGRSRGMPRILWIAISLHLCWRNHRNENVKTKTAFRQQVQLTYATTPTSLGIGLRMASRTWVAASPYAKKRKLH